MTLTQTVPSDRGRQRWPWWPLLPLYPYGRRPTLMRELVPGRIWCFEQLHGVWYVAVPIRMTVLKVEGGLLLYAPLPATPELLSQLRQLEKQHGPVVSIILPTSSGLEHKVPVASLVRACPSATLWISDQQWSFPIQLPTSWLGFPADRTKVLGRDGWPHSDQLRWIPLGPIDLGLGTFHEVACLDRSTAALLVTDSLVAATPTPPDIFDLDPTALLFHARERGCEPLTDTQAARAKGWKRIVLFANFFRPDCVNVPALSEIMTDIWTGRQPHPLVHFGFYPFRWSDDWEKQADRLFSEWAGNESVGLAPVLERLVFVRAKDLYVDWLRRLAALEPISFMISAHYDAPTTINADCLKEAAEMCEHRAWAPSEGSWKILASIDTILTRLKLVPSEHQLPGKQPY